MLKKIMITMATFAVIALAAYAGNVSDRVQVVLARATGTVNWTNTVPYAAVELKQIWINNSYLAVDTVTVQCVTSDTYPQTNTVCVITNAAYKGDANWTLSTVKYMKPNDVLKFTSAQATGCVATVEYQVQKH